MSAAHNPNEKPAPQAENGSGSDVHYLPLPDRDPTPEELEALGVARLLARQGVRLFIAKPAISKGQWNIHGGHGGTGYWFPPDWEKSPASEGPVDEWVVGDALCAVMGDVIDLLDVDPRNGGSFEALEEHKLVPSCIVGAQDTPSGGFHLFVPSMGVASRDRVLPGIDVKAGVDGEGHGFAFLAPTAKVAKGPGRAVGVYRWTKAPTVDLLDLAAVLGGSKSAMAAHVRSLRSSTPSEAGAAYDGPSYAELDDYKRSCADQYVTDLTKSWRDKLADAATWPEGKTDQWGRGWEALSRDVAWSFAKVVAAPWSGLTPEDAGEIVADVMPEVMWENPQCHGKWSIGLVAKAAEGPVAEPPWPEFGPLGDDFWDATPVLSHVRQAAWSRMVGPTVLLGYVLARVLVEIPVGTCDLPPVVGSRATLNLGVLPLGASGDGKSALMETSRDLLGLIGEDQRDVERSIGSGEGLVQSFLEKQAGSPNFQLVPDPRRLFVADEIGHMMAVGDRSGSTLAATLRSALSGSLLGQTNADAARNRHVPSGSYRLVFVAGVQERYAYRLLSESDVGTPQRMLWVPAWEEQPEDDVEWPGSLDWDRPVDLPQLMDYPAHIKKLVKEARRNHGKDPLRGHYMLVRLKVSAALALLHGETYITDQWWGLAGVLCDASLTLQHELQVKQKSQVQQAQDDKVLSVKRSEVRAMEAIQKDAVKQVAKTTLTKLERLTAEGKGDDGWFTKQPLRPKDTFRDLFEPAMDALADAGQVEVQDYVAANRKTIQRYRLPVK